MVERSRSKSSKKVRKKTAGRPRNSSSVANSEPNEVILKILAVARKQFATYGYQGVNLKDVAWEASVANSLITYHFKGKEGLYKACIESFARNRMEGVNRILKDPETVEELRLRLTIFVEEFLLSYIQDPESFNLIHREMNSQNSIAEKVFEDTLLKSFFNVVQFFARAKKRGLISKKFDPTLIATFLFSATCDNAQKDHLGKKYLGKSLENPVWRKQMSDQIVELFMSGVIK